MSNYTSKTAFLRAKELHVDNLWIGKDHISDAIVPMSVRRTVLGNLDSEGKGKGEPAYFTLWNDAAQLQYVSTDLLNALEDIEAFDPEGSDPPSIPDDDMIIRPGIGFHNPVIGTTGGGGRKRGGCRLLWVVGPGMVIIYPGGLPLNNPSSRPTSKSLNCSARNIDNKYLNRNFPKGLTHYDGYPNCISAKNAFRGSNVKIMDSFITFPVLRNAQAMFAECKSLTSCFIDFSSVTNAKNMFRKCPKLTSVDCSYPNAKSIYGMFADCPNITTITSINISSAQNAAFFMRDTRLDKSSALKVAGAIAANPNGSSISWSGNVQVSGGINVGISSSLKEDEGVRKAFGLEETPAEFSNEQGVIGNWEVLVSWN